MSEMFRPDVFERRLRNLAAGYKKRFGDALVYDVDAEIERFKGFRERLAHYVVDAVTFVNDAQNRNARVLIEGSQALMLDVNYGTCTSGPAVSRGGAPRASPRYTSAFEGCWCRVGPEC